MSAVSSWLYVVDYDLPTENPSRRAYFYEKIHKMLRKHFGKDVEFSSYSCYFSADEEVTKKFFAIAKEFCTRATIYKAQELQRYGRKEKLQ